MRHPAHTAALAALAVLLGGLLPGHVARAQQPASQEIEAQQVSGSIWMIPGAASGNIGVSVGDDGILIVDDQFANLADSIRAHLAGMKAGNVDYVLNTHWHQDHTGGNDVWGLEAAILAQERVRERMADANRAPASLPIVTFEQGITVHWNGEAIEAEHLGPAHTDGDSVVWFHGSNVVHLGDLFFNGLFPFVDHNSGGSVAGLIEAIGDLVERIPGDAKIIPGHGPLGTHADLVSFHEMLEATTSYLRAQHAAGKSIDDVKAEGLPEKWSGFSWAFISTDRWIDIVWEEL